MMRKIGGGRGIGGMDILRLLWGIRVGCKRI